MARGLTPAESATSPGANKWSPGEILDHLILSEMVHRKSFTEMIELDRAGKRPVIYRSLSDLDPSPGGIPKTILPLLAVPFTMLNLFVPKVVREFMITNRVLPATNPAAATPAKNRPLADLIQGLEDSFRQTEALFASYPNGNYRRMRVYHPVLGQNSLPDLLRVLTLHERRHHEQFREAVAAIRAQGTATAAFAPSSTT